MFVSTLRENTTTQIFVKQIKRKTLSEREIARKDVSVKPKPKPLVEIFSYKTPLLGKIIARLDEEHSIKKFGILVQITCRTLFYLEKLEILQS